MRTFLSKLVLFILIVGLPFYYLQHRKMVQEDAFYWKATHKARHLVLGGSRALKGIFPAVMKKELGVQDSMLNFAFTGVLSPYGKTYSESIKRKLKTGTERGIYILSVTPGGIMDFSSSRTPREEEFQFYSLWMMNMQPNVEYVFRQPRGQKALLTTILDEDLRFTNGINRVYRDGSQGTFLDKPIVQLKARSRLIKYDLEKSPEREAELRELVRWLSNEGDVFLVRTPISERMLSEEDVVYADFNALMKEISSNTPDTYYLNYSKNTGETPYEFTDGHHHLEGKSAQRFSRQLAKDIRQMLSK